MAVASQSVADIEEKGDESYDGEDPEGRTVKIKEDDTNVDLTHCRLRNIPSVLQNLFQIEILCLRQNLIKDLTQISDSTTLRELDCYDNEIKVIHGIERLTQLT
jgi:protein phosphatase 1 regulatory subunit 7